MLWIPCTRPSCSVANPPDFTTRCTACNGHVGVEYVAMMNHIKSVHNLTKPEYLEKHGSIEYAVIYHRLETFST